MFLDCKNIVSRCVSVMPKKISDDETVTFSVTLSKQAHTSLMEVVGTGYFGLSRGETARTLIGNQLAILAGQGIIAKPAP